MRLLPLLTSYHRTKRLRFTDRITLARHQAHMLGRFFQQTLTKSPYFSAMMGDMLHREFDPKKFATLPTMNKTTMLAHFNQMNTAGLDKEQAFALALQAEKDRDFSPTLHGISVGLSSGTSGQRGLFAVSQAEQAKWAGVMLAKMLPEGLLSGENVALFLRANSNLYQAVKTPCLQFHYYDLLAPFDDLVQKLTTQNPTIIVAPAQVLLALSEHQRQDKIHISPKKVISCAEVLSFDDKLKISQVFENVHEVYQATEGFLASTCPHGTLHLNEEYLYIEQAWLDDERFMPIITDFTRTTQPIVRYRLNDILVVKKQPCACGSACLALAHIEGRDDDGLKFGDIQVFADSVSRVIAINLPTDVDYHLEQDDNHLTLTAKMDAHHWQHFYQNMNAFLAQHGVCVQNLSWQWHNHTPPSDFSKKKRRIVHKADRP